MFLWWKKALSNCRRRKCWVTFCSASHPCWLFYTSNDFGLIFQRFCGSFSRLPPCVWTNLYKLPSLCTMNHPAIGSKLLLTSTKFINSLLRGRLPAFSLGHYLRVWSTNTPGLYCFFHVLFMGEFSIPNPMHFLWTNSVGYGYFESIEWDEFLWRGLYLLRGGSDWVCMCVLLHASSLVN